jgi:toxin ParE1/3/4
MKRSLLIRPEAAAEIQEAFAWYEGQSAGLGTEFEGSLEAILDRIRDNPHQYPAVHREVRRALMRRFPYGVFYLADENQIVVLAVFHGRRDPKHWLKRI